MRKNIDGFLEVGRHIAFCVLVLLISSCFISAQISYDSCSVLAEFRLPSDGLEMELLTYCSSGIRVSNLLVPDDGSGSSIVNLISINGDHILVRIQGHEGWIAQSKLRDVALDKIFVINENGKTEREIALPASNTHLSVRYDSGFLLVDDGEKELKVDLTTGNYIGCVGMSVHKDFLELFSSLGIEDPVYSVEKDNAWVFDRVKAAVCSVDLKKREIVNTFRVHGIPRDASVTGIKEIDKLVYLWGLEYEFEECPLLEVSVLDSMSESKAKKLSKKGGLLTTIGKKEFLFFESGGRIYHYNTDTGKMEVAQKPAIDPMPLKEILYVEEIDRFLGVMLSIY